MADRGDPVGFFCLRGLKNDSVGFDGKSERRLPGLSGPLTRFRRFAFDLGRPGRLVFPK